MVQSVEINVDEEKCIEELRRRMKNELPTIIYDDSHVLRNFLIARNFNLDQAEIMLRKNLDFRKQLKIDTIVKEYKPPEMIKNYLPQNFIGFDKEGSLVRYCALGNIDGRGLFKCLNTSEVFRALIQIIQSDVETLKSRSKKFGKPVNKCVYIYNLEHMTLAKATHKKSIEFFINKTEIFLNNFPELLKTVYIINGSIYFTMVFNVIKKLLSREMLKKIQVFGTDGWKEELLNTIDEDILPAFLGGSRTDSDGNPLCNSFIKHGGIIPESWYFKKNPEKLHQKGGKPITVPAHSSISIPFYVEEPNCLLEWEYECTKLDILFRLQYMGDKDTKIVTLIPSFRVETSAGPEHDNYRCHQPGTYILVFDNTDSWFMSKQIYYIVNVVKEKELIEK